MGKVTVEQIQQRLAAVNERRRYYEWKSEQPGRLVRHETWRHSYLAHPYLLGAPDGRVAERFRHVFMNVMELNDEGKLGPVPMDVTDEYTVLFTHLLEEYNTRVGGAAPDVVISKARAPLAKYFENGPPTGLTMFQNYKTPNHSILVKYGRREFLEPMFTTGELRLANAALYNDEGHLDAVRDDETSRTFFFPTFKERLAGQTHLDFEGNRIEFNDDDIALPLVFSDYYLFCLCAHIHLRMPTDFNADAAIVIRDPERFKQKLISSFLAQFPDWEVIEGPVIYYDPYRDYSKFRQPEMAKHFGYAYQKEVRLVFRPLSKPTLPLEPIFLSIGPMADYADLMTI